VRYRKSAVGLLLQLPEPSNCNVHPYWGPHNSTTSASQLLSPPRHTSLFRLHSLHRSAGNLHHVIRLNITLIFDGLYVSWRVYALVSMETTWSSVDHVGSVVNGAAMVTDFFPSSLVCLAEYHSTSSPCSLIHPSQTLCIISATDSVIK
jgi:hypothetical protein